MNIQEIERLLERFYNGESTIEDENLLREFFSGGNVPPHLRNLAPQFLYYRDQQQLSITDETLEDKVMSRIEDDRIFFLPAGIRRKIIWFGSVAAGILILVTVLIKVNFYTEKITDTYTDPEVAFQEAKKIMLYVSDRFSKGTEKLDQLSKFDEGVDNLKPIASFDKGVQQVSKVKEYNEIEKVFGSSN